MTKYVVLATDNRAAAFYDSGVHGVVPQGAIAISEALWASWLPQTATVTYKDGKLIPFVAPPPTQDQLLAYAEAKQGHVLTAGLIVNVAPTGKPAQSVEVSTDAHSLTLLHTAVGTVQADPNATVSWVTDDGTFDLPASQVLAISAAVNAFVQSTMTTLGQVNAAIRAGKIKKFAQIDMPPSPIPAWPANS